MNSKFFITLKKVCVRSESYPNAIEDLNSAYNELVSIIIDVNNQLNQNFKGYARGSYNQITELQLVYEKHNKELWEINLKKLTPKELDKLQSELNYYRDVLSLCDDARAILLEYLANYYPEIFKDNEKKALLKQLLPFSVIAKGLSNKVSEKTITQLSETIPSKTNKLIMSQIAIIHSYTEDRITLDNCDKISYDYGFTSKTSGKKLYQKFNKYSKATDRKGDEGTKKKNENKIALIESIIDLLPNNNNKEKARDEIKILNSILESQY